MNKQLSVVAALAIVMVGILLWYGSSLTPESENGLRYPAEHDGESTPIVGGDRDVHGCILSAGYSWCEERNECIRPWETYCTATPGKTVTFACNEGMTVKATFYVGDDKFVDLVLSDGRALTIPRAVSASGARYANDDESFVFWNKGDTAFITEMGGEETFSGCVLQQEP